MELTSAQRKEFCRWYLARGNVREAAVRAGCSPETAEAEGLQLLTQSACRRYLGQLAAQPALPLQALCTAGLARLAFGSANDAVRLAFAEEELSPALLERLDLFHVTGIKRDKNGIDIKLADRQRAIEKLLECAEAVDSANAAAALLEALSGDEQEVMQYEAGALFREAEDRHELVADAADEASGCGDL